MQTNFNLGSKLTAIRILFLKKAGP